jgi:hypothetical protein
LLGKSEKETIMTHPIHAHGDPDMQQCIQQCLTCHSICLATVQHCLQMDGPHAEAGHIRLLLDCADICQTSANFMLRGSDLHMRTCATCAEVCDRCAQSCEALAEDAQIRACAEECRRCADSCRRMAAMAA